MPRDSLAAPGSLPETFSSPSSGTRHAGPGGTATGRTKPVDVKIAKESGIGTKLETKESQGSPTTHKLKQLKSCCKYIVCVYMPSSGAVRTRRITTHLAFNYPSEIALTSARVYIGSAIFLFRLSTSTRCETSGTATVKVCAVPDAASGKEKGHRAAQLNPLGFAEPLLTGGGRAHRQNFSSLLATCASGTPASSAGNCHTADFFVSNRRDSPSATLCARPGSCETTSGV